MSHYNDLFLDAKSFGVVDVPRNQQYCFRVFFDRSNSYTIETSGQPMHAYWSGSNIIVEMDNGDKRIYNSLDPGGYQIIYN